MVGARTRGLTLIEVLTAATILLLLAAGGSWTLRRASNRSGPQALAERIASECRSLRAQALASGVPHALALPAAVDPAHSDSFYTLKGHGTPVVLTSTRSQAEYPGALLFAGHWALTGGLVNEPPAPIEANQGFFDLSAWSPPRPQDAIYVFTPSGAVVSNRPRFGAAHHIVVCNDLSYSAASVGGTPSARLDSVSSPFTVKISQSGLVTLSSSLLGASLPAAGGGPLTTPLLPPSPMTGGNSDPILDPLEFQPQPVAATLPPGVSATVAPDRHLTLTARATDPDGDELSAVWTADGGTFTSEVGPMTYDGTHWVSSVEWSPPAGALPPEVYQIQVEVQDGRGGSATADLGATGRVRILERGRIVFDSDRTGVYDIYVMNWDGTDQRRLTDANAIEGLPTLSPDGSQIAYHRNGDLWVMNSDGTNQRMVAAVGPLAPGGAVQRTCWSPDGNRIAFVVRDAANSIYVYDPSAATPVQAVATGMPFGDYQSIQWHYDRPHTGNPSEQRLVYSTNTGALEIGLVPPYTQTTVAGIVADELSISPDGTKIAYCFGSVGYIANYTPGSVSAPIYSAPGMVTINWSPDQQYLVYDDGFDIFRCNVDFSNAVPISQSGWEDDEPHWGP